MFLSYQRIATSATVKGLADLIIPPKATFAELQADTGSIRYRLDGGEPSSANGMLLLVTEPPRLFLIEDLRKISFCQGSGAGNLNIHYGAGRDV